MYKCIHASYVHPFHIDIQQNENIHSTLDFILKIMMCVVHINVSVYIIDSPIRMKARH